MTASHRYALKSFASKLLQDNLQESTAGMIIKKRTKFKRFILALSFFNQGEKLEHQLNI